MNRLFAAAVLVRLLTGSAASAQQPIDITEVLLTIDPNSDTDARASGASTAYVSEQAGTNDVYVLDGAGIVTLAAGGPGAQFNPDIDGDVVVYVDNSLGDWNVGLVDLAAGTNQILTIDPAGDYDPVVDEDLVAFVTERNGNRDIMLYDVITGLQSFATFTPNAELAPALDAGFLAWTVFQNGSNDVMARDVDGPPFLVAGGPSNQSSPSVAGDRIAYLVDGDVAVYDRATGLTTRLTQDAFDQTNVVIEGDRVVWRDDRNGNYDLFLHDLSTHLTYQITEDPSDQWLGDVDGERVVFHDIRMGDYNVWELNITINPQVAFDVREARVTRPRHGDLGRASMSADLTIAQPGPDDLIAVEMDGVVLFSEPFSAFTPLANERWALRRLRLTVDLDLRRREIEVDSDRVDISGLDNTDGVELLMYVGGAVGLDHIVMQERGRRLEYQR